jgi:3'(2'), 5'-bisphosphate nucleotidase
MSEKEFDELLSVSLKAIIDAGKAVMDIYNNSYHIEYKKDNSPLTYADLKSNEIITSHLGKTSIPIISEESADVDYTVRKNWDSFWIVDPLDGTKEFIQKNGEFTINIALVHNERPVIGVVYAPAVSSLYYSCEGRGAFKNIINPSEKISVNDLLKKSTKLNPKNSKKLLIAASRSHLNVKTLNFIEKVKTHFSGTKVINKGSSLKFCLLAEGSANIYPRFGRTMEWDTAAGHAIINSAGGKVFSTIEGEELLYNKPELSNPDFVAVDSFNCDNSIFRSL